MYIFIFLLLIFISSLLLVRWRNVESFPLMRQLNDFSTFMVPFNIPAYLLSKVPLTHFVGIEHFPELKLIEDNWIDIRDEALALHEKGQITIKNDLPASSFYKDNRWTSF